MTSYLPSIPPLSDFFPPTPQAYNLLLKGFKVILPVLLYHGFFRLILSRVLVNLTLS